MIVPGVCDADTQQSRGLPVAALVPPDPETVRATENPLPWNLTETFSGHRTRCRPSSCFSTCPQSPPRSAEPCSTTSRHKHSFDVRGVRTNRTAAPRTTNHTYYAAIPSNEPVTFLSAGIREALARSNSLSGLCYSTGTLQYLQV